jgi:hypothetical protein
MATIFALNKDEESKMNRWITTHSKKCQLLPQQAYSIVFTPTGIGDNVHVKCPHCKKEKDITDYSSW